MQNRQGSYSVVMGKVDIGSRESDWVVTHMQNRQGPYSVVKGGG